MQFEDFDRRIKEAGENHHPTYNENAWDKMEQLLDRHLPQKRDDRRRFLFFILFPLLMAGGALLIISKPWGNKDEVTIAETNKQAPNNNPIRTEPAQDNQPIITGDELSPSSTPRVTETSPVPVLESKPGKKVPANSFTNNTGILADQQFDATVNAPGIKKKLGKSEKVIDGSKEKVAEEKIKVEEKANDEVKGEVIARQDKSDVKVNNNVDNRSSDVTSKEDIDKKKESADPEVKKEQQPADAVTKKEKPKKKKSNELFFTFSAGPDISAVGDEGPGKAKLVIGAGVGYTFMDRLTLRAGFYSARKIYSAGKEDYKPAVTPPNYYYLDNVDANCKVYEIPITLSYRFGRSTRHHFFAGAGLSSYLMKEEVYDYTYKYPGNPPVIYTHTYSYKNENNHYFSVLGISGGYQRNLNRNVAISAEPYLRIPLSGVGAGNVKLNSAGVLFSISVKPFK
jgi:hypothetical protein